MEAIKVREQEVIWDLASEWVDAGWMDLSKVTRLHRLCKINRLDLEEVLDAVRAA